MFFLTYLRRELRRRMRQSVFIALGLAVGIGLVVTVSAASAGVKKAQAKVLSSLYGVGTGVTVTGRPPASQEGAAHGAGLKTLNGESIGMGATGPQICKNGTCRSAAGQAVELLTPGTSKPFSQPAVASVARLRYVTAASGGLALTDNQVTIPANGGEPMVNTVILNGVDLANRTLSPLSLGTITAGRSLRPSDAGSDVAVVDSGYAKSRNLAVGSTVTIGTKFTVVGIVSQPQGNNPAQVYMPLQTAQAFTLGDGTSLQDRVNTIYVTAASAANVSAVDTEIGRLLPGYPVTTASGLANQVTGSLSSAATLANDLGRWLSVLVLIAAFAVACLLTMAAVARRVREFGTLKALGWRSRRIVTQVLGESVSTGLAGGAVGVGLGYAGVAIIGAIAPTLSATATAPAIGQLGPRGGSAAPAATHTVSVPSPPRSAAARSCWPSCSRWPAGCWPARSAAGASPSCGPPPRWPGWGERARRPPPRHPSRPAGEEPMYTLTKVTKTFQKGRREVAAVRDLDLVIDDGDWLAVQGRTGHGKSTLLSLLGGLDRPTSGTIQFQGKDLAALKEAQVTRVRSASIGFIFQTFNLVPTLSAAENVEAALVPLRTRAAGRHQRVAAALESVGLADRARHLPAELSGGQQQRVAIARALVKEPKVLLADEPTGNLDEHTRDDIIALLEKLWRERGLTLVLVTHDSTIARQAQRIGVMKQGQLSIRQDIRRRFTT